MKFKKNYKIIIFVLIFLSIALLIFFNLDYTKFIIEKKVRFYGYTAVLVLSFLADFIAQPIGPEVPGGFGLVFGLKFYYAFLLTLIGSYSGSFGSYFIGKTFLHSDIKDICTKKHCDFFFKYGKFALLIASVTPVPYTIFCWLSGAFKIRLTDFVIFGLIPRTIRIFVIMFLIGAIF